MAERPNYDCLIVGGGPVGASLACALGSQPLRICLVEAVPRQAYHQPSYDDRGLVLAPASQRILTGLDFWSCIETEVTAIQRIHVSDENHFGFTHLDAEMLGMAALGHVVPARRLGQALATRLEALANLEILCPARLHSLHIEPDCIEATILDGEQPRSLSARLLIAADGASSAARKLLGIGAHEWDYRQDAVVANLTIEGGLRHTAYERFTASGPLALLPLADERCVSVLAVTRERTAAVLALADADYKEMLERRLGGRCGPILAVGHRRSYPIKLIRTHSLFGPRYVVIGNAAHTVHPNAAQGLNLGLRDVALLAECLVDAARCGGDIGAGNILRHYAALRRCDQRRVLALSHGLALMFYNQIPPLIVARDLAMLAVDIITPLKRAFMRTAMGLGGPQPRLARGLPL